MFFVIYFWIYSALTAVGVFALLFRMGDLSLGDWLSLVNGFILVLGLYIYTYKKKEYYRWKTLILINFIITLVLTVDYFIFSEGLLGAIHPSFKSNLNMGMVDVVIGTILSLPAYYANFKLLSIR